ncbi:MAG TPA: patatin-like phospholipase family protein [Micropepsaceae bacterium]|nr:patatin-like phospholipase family protein [Micropepsaceae bacterium]
MGWFEPSAMARNFDLSFFAPLLSSGDSSFPPALLERLKSFRILEQVGDQALRRLLASSEWFGLPGGTHLARDGDNDRAVFLVVTGSLGVFVESGNGGKRQVATIPAGETVGEMSLLTGESHSALLVALRDTELLRIGAKAFDGLITRHPRVMFNLLKIVVRRLRETTRGAQQRTRPKTFAMVPLQRGVPEFAAVRSMADALVKMGAKAAVLDSSASHETTEWFNRFEAEHDVVFYLGDQPDSSWTHLCLRQADRVMLIARSDEPEPLHPFERRFFQREMCATPELLLVHSKGQRAGGVPRHIEFRSDLFGSHHHVRTGNIEDIKRLARFIAGSAVNIVMAGGGARGFAHIGVLRALREAGVPFDCVGGTSMGGIIAAGVAMEWDVEEISERVRDSFVANRPLSDFTLPLIALFRGAKVSGLLKKHFGDVLIEDLPKPYFCVSSDLTTGRDHVHRSGPLWRALRASVAVPGILPPVAEGGHLLVDGGVMNNLPVDVMAADARGPIIAVDVSGEIDLRCDDERYGERSVFSLIMQRMRGTPSIVSILMRAGTVGSDSQRRQVRALADFIIEPPMTDISIRDWNSYDRIIEEGYVYTMRDIEKNGVPLSDSWTAGPALSVNRTGHLQLPDET